MWIKEKIRKIILQHRSDSDSYVQYLRNKGAKIGERVSIFEPRKVYIDETRPYLVQIGDDVKITNGVTILTHGYDWNVLAGVKDTVLGSAGAVTIGNNVFIGMNATILKGVRIGNNVVIGAGSLVNHDIPDNCVAAGNPVRVICSIEEYYEKRVNLQRQEAFEMYQKYVERFGEEPPMEIFDEFFWLFYRREEELPPSFARQMQWHGRFNEVYRNFKNTQPEFDGYADFCKQAKKHFEKGNVK